MYETQYRRVMEERRTIRFDGASLFNPERWFEVNVIPTTTGIAVYYRDISDRKRSELLYKASFELDGIGKAHAAAAEGRFRRVNARMMEITGYQESELLGMCLDSVDPSRRHREADRARWESLCAGEGDVVFDRKADHPERRPGDLGRSSRRCGAGQPGCCPKDDGCHPGCYRTAPPDGG